MESDHSNEVIYTVPDALQQQALISPPVATAMQLTVAEDSPLSILLSADTATLALTSTSQPTYTVVQNPSFGALSGTPPNLTYTPAANYNGSDSFQYTVSQGGSVSAPALVGITVTPVNDAPTAVTRSYTLPEDSSTAIVLQGNDVDSSLITYTITRQPSKGSVIGTPPNLVYTPIANYAGTDSLDYTVSDGSKTSLTGTIFLIVSPINDVPTAIPDSISAVGGTSKAITLRGSDVEGSPLTFQIIRQPTKGTLSGAPPNLTYLALASASGSDSFEFTVNDGTATSPGAVVSINISSAINTAPVVPAITRSIPEDSLLSLTLAGSDAEGNPLTYQVTRGPTNGTYSLVLSNLVYIPRTNFNGTDSMEYVANDGRVNSAAARISLTVTPVNDAPVAIDQSASVPEDSSVSVVLRGSDVEGSPLTYLVSKQPVTGRLMGTAPNLIYIPTSNFNGSDSFQFTVSDGALTSTPGTVYITVVSVNDPPRPTPRSLTVAEDRSLGITVSATDADGDTLTYAISGFPTNGTLTGTPPSVIYSPNNNYFGTDSFTFSVTDGKSAPVEAKVSLAVTAVNDAPTVSNSAVAVVEDTATPFVLRASDVDNTTLTYTIKTRPVNGTVGGTAPNLTYTPRANYNGTDSMTFSVSDGTLGSTTATVSFTVSAVNDAPVAVARSVSTAYNTSVAITLTATDPESNPLTFRVSRAPSRGTLTGTPPALTYKPNTGSSGTDSFEFTAYDGNLTSAPATVTITVAAPTTVVSPQPDALLVTPSGIASRLIDGSSSVSANDGSAGNARVELRQAPRYGVVQLAGDGTFYYFHGGGREMQDSFSYVTTVDGTTSAPVTVTVHVFQVSSIQRSGEQAVLSFPVTGGVTYRIEGSASSSSWELLGELQPESTSIADVPTPAPADGANRFFRITATDANGTLSSDVVGFRRVALQAGVQTYSPGFHGRTAGQFPVAGASGNTIQLSAASLSPAQFASQGGSPSYIAVRSGTTQWWPILDNQAGTLTVDSQGDDLGYLLGNGDTVEVIELPTASQTFGSPGDVDSGLAVGDYVDFVSGSGLVSTIEVRATAGGAALFLRSGALVSGPISPASITFLPGQPIQIQKGDSTGTAWFLGRSQPASFAPRLAGGTTTSGLTSQ